MKTDRLNILIAIAFTLILVFLTNELFTDEPDVPQQIRSIPGITTPDSFPHSCVSCHKNYPDLNSDTRISTILKNWNENGVKPELLAKFQSAAPEGVNLKGKHSFKSDGNTSIPEACNKCHGKSMKSAMPLSQLIHIIHLTGGNDNRFISMFQGECTHCHKLNSKSGTWSVVNGKESEEGK